VLTEAPGSPIRWNLFSFPGSRAGGCLTDKRVTNNSEMEEHLRHMCYAEDLACTCAFKA
jgi:hypothetical protein